MPLLSTFGAASGRSFGGIGAAAAGEVLDIDDVFSTYLYTGNGSTNAITNGIDLSGEGGLTWLKHRSSSSFSAADHWLIDTERGGTKYIRSNSTGAQSGNQNYVTFNSDGFTLGTSDAEINFGSGNSEYASWTFRKAPKFFDVITYSGNSTAGRTISHNLGCTVGQVWVKRTNTSNNWACWHRGIANNQYLQLNSPNQAYSDGGIFWNNTTPSSTTVTLGADSGVNATGSTYVMYVFAHNNNDGGFGPDSDQDVIKCGSYTGNGSATGPTVNLGFEPQIIMYKNTSGTGNWQLHDVMRGIPTGSNDAIGYANKNWAENSTNDWLDVNATGFQIKASGSDANTNGETYIYMAIRRGPLAEPESGADVFGMAQSNRTNAQGDYFQTTAFNVDMHLNMFRDWENGTPNKQLTDRIRGSGIPIYPPTNGTEGSFFNVDFNRKSNAYKVVNYFQLSSSTKSMHWYWRRAPGYFDMVAYPGNGSTQNVSHNLGAVPEMIWIKSRNATEEWKVYHSAIGNNKELVLSSTAASGNTSAFNYTTPTSSVFSLGAASPVNDGAYNFIAYLFASVAGVSKVGSFSFSTGGSSTNVTCGFQPRFILLKKYNGTGNWHMFDTSRGITSGNDHRLELDTTDQNNNGFDWVDLTSDGFTFNDIMGEANSSYIFYAIA